MTHSTLLIHNARIVSMDDEIGVLDNADILIEDGVISRIGQGLQGSAPDDARLIDATGKIVAPGFIDTHRHTWQTQIRGLCADWVLGDYLAGVRFTVSPAYTPEDVRLGNYAGAIEALDAGVTTILDFSHCNNSPAHSDAAVDGLIDAGIRAVFGYGFFDSSPAAPAHFTNHSERIDDFHRIANRLGDAPDSLVQIGAALNEGGVVPIEATAAEVAAARERNAVVVTHTACVWGLPTEVAQLDAHGLLDPRQVHVHCNALSDSDWEILARHGAKISISPETELNMGMGRPVFRQALDHGLKPTLSADVVSLNSGDLFHQLRLGLGFARWADAEATNLAGDDPLGVSISAHDALKWVTVNAAEALGLEDRIGSVTVGKRADLIIVGGRGRSMHPAADPEAALVFQTTVTDVETVLVDGVVVKERGQLVDVDVDKVDADLERSAEAILARISAAGQTLPGTPPGGMWTAIRAGLPPAEG